MTDYLDDPRRGKSQTSVYLKYWKGLGVRGERDEALQILRSQGNGRAISWKKLQGSEVMTTIVLLNENPRILAGRECPTGDPSEDLAEIRDILAANGIQTTNQ